MINIIIAGDFCPQERVAEKFNQHDYKSVLGGVKSLLNEVDYALVNLECPICEGNEKPINKCGPNLFCSSAGIEALSWSGFDCVTLANNHFYDFGEEGVSNTIKKCSELGIDYVGGGSNLKEASCILYKTISGKIIAFINCCEYEFSHATNNKGGSNPLNSIQQFYSIIEAKQNADFVILIIHGGHEMWHLPSPRMVELYRYFIDVGADAVINHHQHCYSGYEVYKGCPIFYGLGNFCFDERESGYDGAWNYGYLVNLIIDETLRFKLFPYKQCYKDADICLLPISSFDDNLKELNGIILDSKVLQEKTFEYYSGLKRNVLSMLNPFPFRLIQSLQSRRIIPYWANSKWLLKMQNVILCESHRDILDFFFNNRNLK